MNTKIIGIIGCGVIGSALGEYAKKELNREVDRVILYDTVPHRAEALAEKLGSAEIAASVAEVADEADLILEAAAPVAVPEVLRMAVEKKKDAMIMSVGGLLGREDLLQEARESGIKVILPSGAIAGVDALKAAKISGIESVTLTTRKAPRSVKGAPYLAEKGIDAEAITDETVIFEGNATDAMKGFPQNINVAALLSIAGIGPEKTRVKIIVSPAYTRNTHEIEVKSKAGVMTLRVENVPSPMNPKTSYLAVLSAIAALRSYFDPIRLGT
ncbi:MAG: aspartate dehydrogenase [Candidatus Omnitrophota bacterium]